MIFGYEVVLITIISIRIFLSSTIGFGNLNNLKGDPYNTAYSQEVQCYG